MKIDEEEMMFEQKDFARSSDTAAERVLVWSKKARKREEEDYMFLKQRSCEKESRIINICSIRFGAK